MDKKISPEIINGFHESFRMLMSITAIIVSDTEPQAIDEYRQMWNKFFDQILRIRGNRLGHVELTWNDVQRMMELGIEMIRERLEEFSDDN